jgi:putative membrane protein
VLILAVTVTLASLRRQLPAQNVLAVSLVIAILAAAVQTLGFLTGIPFGRFAYTDEIGPRFFPPLPCAMPLVWLVAILAARGTARLILRPGRTRRNYGLRLLGLTVLLAVLFDLGLEPFATQVKHYWSWEPAPSGVNWYGTPWTNFIGWAAAMSLVLIAATPWLINKKPGPEAASYEPLAVWALLNLLFATSAARHQLWAAALLVSTGTAVVTLLAARGGRIRENLRSD